MMYQTFLLKMKDSISHPICDNNNSIDNNSSNNNDIDNNNNNNDNNNDIGNSTILALTFVIDIDNLLKL